MKIIFIITSLEGFGGTNRVATLLANSLSSHHDITVLSRDSIENTYLLESQIRDIKFKGSNISFVYQCKRYIELDHPDIVIIHTMSKLTPALLLGGIKAKNVWSIEHISYDFHSFMYKQLRKKLYTKINKVITLTQNDALNYKTFHTNVNVMANPTPFTLKANTSIRITEPPKTIISVGRLTNQKGYDLLIEAWSLVEPIHPDWSLNLYGTGEDKAKLEKLIFSFNLQNVILKSSTNDVQAVYDDAAFYVMSSRYEGFGMVLIEAQSRGLPIVSFDCPSGPAEIVHHGIDGILVQNGNVPALAEAMIHMIENPQLRQAMAREALQSAQGYHIDTVIDKWLALLADA